MLAVPTLQTLTGNPTPTTPTASSAGRTGDIDQLVSTLRNDASLRVFLSDDFSPRAHVGAAVLAQRVPIALQDAQRASTILSASVRQHVIRRKDALLAEVEAVDALEKEVSTVSSGVASLVAATTALSDAIDAPYHPMSAAVNRLKNLSTAANLVRALHRFRFCTNRLADAGLFPVTSPTASTTAQKLPAAAEAVRELEELIAPSAPVPLDKIEGISKDILAVRKANVEVRKRASSLLKTALAERNQTDVEAAVLAFNALSVLQDRISGEIARLVRETQSVVHRGLEPPVQSHSFEADVWSSVDRMLNAVADSCFKAILLQHVLSRKYSPVTHLSLLQDTVASSFIDAVSRTIAEQMSILSRTRLQRAGAAQVFITLAEGYPRLRILLKDLASRVNALARLSPIPITKLGTTKLPIIPGYEFIEKEFLGATVEVETHYFTASLERLTKTVNNLFQNGKQPGETEALNFTRLLSSELSAARGDKQLFRAAVSNVATAIRLYTSQAEDLVAANVPDEDTSGSTMGEISDWHLTTLYNSMVVLHTSAIRVLGERDGGSGDMPEPIAKELSTLLRLSELLLDGPFSMCRSYVFKVMQRMHTEDLEGEVGDDGCSVYVLDISAQLSMFGDGVIPSLARSKYLGACTVALAKWVLETFTRHVSLVFPQSEAAKVRLSTDMARIELAVESLCPARLLGKSYRSLRALRTCIILPTDDFAQMDDALMNVVRELPPSVVGHLILGRCNDRNLLHPHRRQDKAPSEYVEWLENHSEGEAWAAVEQSLKSYQLRKDADVENVSEYNTLISLSEKLKE